MSMPSLWDKNVINTYIWLHQYGTLERITNKFHLVNSPGMYNSQSVLLVVELRSETQSRSKSNAMRITDARPCQVWASIIVEMLVNITCCLLLWKRMVVSRYWSQLWLARLTNGQTSSPQHLVLVENNLAISPWGCHWARISPIALAIWIIHLHYDIAS